MSLLEKVLAGVGDWMIKEGQFQMEKAKADLLFSRELALKQLDYAHDDAKSARDHSERLDEITLQGVIADRKDRASDERDLNKAITLKGIDFSNEKQLEAFKHKNRLSEDQFTQALQAGREARARHEELGQIVYTNKGMTVYKKDGTAFTFGDVTKAASPDDGGDSLSDYRPGGGAAAAQPAPASPAAAPTPLVAGTRARNANGDEIVLNAAGKWVKPDDPTAP
jgi:hypothetical protein